MTHINWLHLSDLRIGTELSPLFTPAPDLPRMRLDEPEVLPPSGEEPFPHPAPRHEWIWKVCLQACGLNLLANGRITATYPACASSSGGSNPSDEGGCACRAVAAQSTPTSIPMLSLLGLALLAVRRRRAD